MKRLMPLFLIVVLSAFAGSASAYDIRINANIPLADKISGISINPDAGTALAAGKETKTLYLIDTLTNAVIKKIPLDAVPSGVAVYEKKNYAVVSSKDGALYFIDLVTGNPVKTINTGRTIHAIAINKDSDMLYIGNSNSLVAMDLTIEKTVKELVLMEGMGELSIYNSETLQPFTEIKICSSTLNSEPGTRNCNLAGVSVNQSTHIAVLTNNSDNSISIISLENKTVLDTVPLNSPLSRGVFPTLEKGGEGGFSVENPGAIAIDPVTNTALISHTNGIAVVKLENPVPLIHTLIPEFSRVGDAGFTLSIKGEKFVKETKARFNRKELETKPLDNFSLQADVPSSELQAPRNVDVTVVNPSPGGGPSNKLSFRIYNPMPALEYISPDTILLTSNNELRSLSPQSLSGDLNSELVTTFRVYGKGFLPVSGINLNGQDLKTRFISSILLEAEIKPADIESPGKYMVVVINPSPGTFTSNAVYLNVVKDATDLQGEETQTPALGQAQSTQKKDAAGTLKGRILNTNKEPVEGVTVKTKNISAVTDSNGYFTLENVPSGRRHLMVHGSTVKDAGSHYPTIPLTIDIQAGMINEMPFQIYLHRQKNYNFKDINPDEDTVLTDPEVPGFEIKIPKGIKITGWDGKPNKKVSVRTVPADRLPVKPLPSNANVRTVYMFYFDKEGGGIPDEPIAIKSRNDLGLLPGEKAVLWYYDESPNEGEAPNDWAIAGTGTVTPDGKYIVSDLGVGIPKFCCGATAWGGSGSGGDGSGGDGDSGGGSGGAGGDDGGNNKPPDPCGNAGDPVNLATGYFIHSKTDLHIPGIIPVNITRYYRSGVTGLGAFGIGTYFEYDWWLGAYGADGQLNDTNPTMLLLIKPGNFQYRFTDPDGDGTFTNTTDSAFSGVTVSYDSFYETRTLRMRDGIQYKFIYSEKYNGELMEIADRNGNKLNFTRQPRPESGDDAGGYLTGITTSEGRTITFNQTYTGNFFQTDSITDSAGRTVTYTYEDDPLSVYPRLQKVTSPDGGVLEYHYDASGRMSEIINERGIREVLNEYYDAPPEKQNRIYRQTHADGGIYLFDYTIAGGNISETTMTAPNGAVTTWRFYDDLGNFYDKYIVKKTTSDGATIYSRQLGSNLITSITDPLNRVMNYTYYPNGQVQTVTDNLGNVTRYEYEAVYGLTTKITDANLKDTTFTHTFVNNKLTKTDIRDPLLHLTTTNYNSYGMQTSITDANNNTTTFLYDNAGKPAELTRVIDALSNTTINTYDSLGRLWTITDAKGKTTTYTYDNMDRMIEVKDPLDGITIYTYDKKGNLRSVTDAKNQTIRYEYDTRDRIKKMTDQLGRDEVYTYYTGTEITPTTGDNLKSITDRKGQVTTFNEYDSRNRIKKITYQDGSYVQYTYDTVGRIDYINDSISGFIDYTYNDFGCTTCSGIGRDRISQEVTPLGTIDYTYDKLGRRQTMTVAGEPDVTYTYYDNGRLKDVIRKIGTKSRTYTLAYDNGGRRTSLALPMSQHNKYVTTNYAPYDNANRLLGMDIQGPTAQIENLVYGYDAKGNRTSMNRLSVTLPMPNAVTNTSYNDANQMLAFNDKNISYDNNGNLLTSTNAAGTANYTWNARNQLTAISGPSLTASFKYDALGRRIEKTINGTTTKFLYDGVDIMQEIQGTAKTSYIRMLNIDEPLTRIKADGTVRHYVKDALGSVIALTDDSGVVKTTYAYDPFGNTTVSGETSDNPIQYTGRENDNTGLYYYRSRYYSPELQRFVSEDRLECERKHGNNLYLYVRSNPINLVDPLGLDPYEPLPSSGCEYYKEQCNKNKKCEGGDKDEYPCKAYQCCKDFGDGPTNNCVRGCLIKWDKEKCSKLSEPARTNCRKNAHASCYSSCLKLPVNIPPSCGGIL
ncbi:MAG: hypothetical protein HZC48_01325 [Nitrospirae bacterium]|nr:hypothetical protein [Nitrospirota bacterium]